MTRSEHRSDYTRGLPKFLLEDEEQEDNEAFEGETRRNLKEQKDGDKRKVSLSLFYI